MTARTFILRMRRRWHELSDFKKRWFRGIFLGLIVEGILHLGGHSTLAPAFTAVENAAVDISMRGNAGIGMSRPPEPKPVGIIDIDDETWRNPKWNGGRPMRASRGLDGLAGLLKYAIATDARYIVLDIVVEQSGDDPEPKLQELVGELRPHPGQYIIFARSVEDPIGGTSRLAPVLPPSPLDRFIDLNPISLHRAAPYFRASADGIVRDWQLWKVGCRVGSDGSTGRWTVLPSVQLLIAVFEKQRDVSPDKATSLQELETLLGLQPPAQGPDMLKSEGACYTDFPRSGAVLPDQGRIITGIDSLLEHRLRKLGLLAGLAEPKPGAADLSSRVVFTIASPPRHDEVRTLSALKLVSDPAAARHARNFTGGLVVIGQSFMLAGGQVETPIGRMPGAMVLINSVNSMQRFRALVPIDGVAELVLSIVEVVLIALLLALVVVPAAFLVTLITLLVANYFLLIQGIWLDFSMPTLAIGLHRVLDYIRELFEPEPEPGRETRTRINIDISRLER